MLSVIVPIAAASYASTLVGTSWRVTLDIGLERGSWMPRNVEGWGASGARVVVSTLVNFEASGADEGEELVGLQRQTRVLTARDGGKIVTFEGEQEVRFTSGGWCVQRPLGAQSASDEGLLRFWLDCPSGCAKGDVSIPQGERIFFSTGVWDDADGLRKLRLDKATVDEKLAKLDDQEEFKDVGDFFGNFPGFALRRKIARQEELGLLTSRRKYYESFLGLAEPSQVALMAARGSMSLKRQRGTGLLGRTLGTEYHILGTFTAQPMAHNKSD